MFSAEALSKEALARQLIKAIEEQNLTAVNAAIASGVTVVGTLPEYPEGYTALHLAAQYDTGSIVQALLTAGAIADINTQVLKALYTPLYLAAAPRTLDSKNATSVTVKKLLEAGAKVDHKVFNKKTALIRAAQYNYQTIAHELIKAGADVNNVSSVGCTALLHCLFDREKLSLVKILLEAGASPNIKFAYDTFLARQMTVRSMINIYTARPLTVEVSKEHYKNEIKCGATLGLFGSHEYHYYVPFHTPLSYSISVLYKCHLLEKETDIFRFMLLNTLILHGAQLSKNQIELLNIFLTDPQKNKLKSSIRQAAWQRRAPLIMARVHRFSPRPAPAPLVEFAPQAISTGGLGAGSLASSVTGEAVAGHDLVSSLPFTAVASPSESSSYADDLRVPQLPHPEVAFTFAADQPKADYCTRCEIQ